MVMLAFLVIRLLATRRVFYRRVSLFAQSFSIGWFSAVGCLVAGVIWVLFFVYRDVPYGNELWWQFAFNAHAPRSLRAITGLAVVLLSYSFWQLLRPTSGRMTRPDPDELTPALDIIRKQPPADDGLALAAHQGPFF